MDPTRDRRTPRAWTRDDEAVMDIASWLGHYRHAWVAADTTTLVALFTPDASYRSFVFNEPYIGRDAIGAYWDLATTDQSDVEVRFGEPVVDGNRVAVEFWTTMNTTDDGLVTLVGTLLMTFEHGRCLSLREYWHLEPGRQQPPPGWGH